VTISTDSGITAFRSRSRSRLQRAASYRVASYVDGANVAFRGSAPEGEGFWFAPAVVLASPSDAIAQQEVFGPVVAVMPFDDEADAIRLANDTIYGLAGSIWTESLGRAVRVSRGVQSGVLSVNSHASVRYATPFGGMKSSGLGRELGPDAAEHFTETKNVFFATDAS
jgi:betaine-aldehyde dehydrogenase